MLLPLKEPFPRMKLLWGDGHYAGSLITLAKVNLGWITRWRRLCRDHEGLPESSGVEILLSASYRMLTRLAPAFLS